MNFSVLISVYAKESPLFLDAALQSIGQQTRKADEIVLVKDGPLTEELEKVIASHLGTSKIPYVIVPLEKNSGLGIALNEGLKRCRFPWVARMDGDDIAMPDRFAVQTDYLAHNPDTDVLGSWISEFSDDPHQSSGERRPPCGHHEIFEYAKCRNPLNHMTVMFRKKSVEDIGGYMTMNGFEDYYLWIRMLKKGYTFANIDRVLVKARTGEGMIRRRKGWSYVKNEWYFAKAVWKLGFFSNYEFLRNVVLRSIPRLFPTFFVQGLYSFLRRS
jgi:glycosyltransferase involved in cell wall biosynthesis